MKQAAPPPDEALAHALAMIVAANGRIDASEMTVLDQLDAYQRVGVTRERFVDLARACVDEVGAHLCDRSWLCADHLAYIDALKAPAKKLVWFEGSGHEPFVDEPTKFNTAMAELVRPVLARDAPTRPD